MRPSPASPSQPSISLPPRLPLPPSLWCRLQPEQQRQLAHLVADLLRRRWTAISRPEVTDDD